MKPNIFIVGPSGSGKSTSLRNCDPLTTAILNSEQKALPFKGAGKFIMNGGISGVRYDEKKERDVPCMKEYWKKFNSSVNHEKVNILVNESFTSLTEQIYAYSNEYYNGFDLWKSYNEEITKVLHRSKNTEKYIVFTGTDMIIEGDAGVEERCVNVQGNRWKKNVEKELVIVLYTNAYTDNDGNIKYRFITNKMKGFENIPAKSPMGMLPSTMDNDLNLVIQKIEEYYNEEEPTI